MILAYALMGLIVALYIVTVVLQIKATCKPASIIETVNMDDLAELSARISALEAGGTSLAVMRAEWNRNHVTPA